MTPNSVSINNWLLDGYYVVVGRRRTPGRLLRDRPELMTVRDVNCRPRCYFCIFALNVTSEPRTFVRTRVHADSTITTTTATRTTTTIVLLAFVRHTVIVSRRIESLGGGRAGRRGRVHVDGGGGRKWREKSRNSGSLREFDIVMGIKKIRF